MRGIPPCPFAANSPPPAVILSEAKNLALLALKPET